MTSERPRYERREGSGVGYHGLSAVQRKFTNLSLSKTTTSSSRDEDASEKTRIGLTELYSPDFPPLIDFIFVHGLRGGSIKTWRKYDAPGYFWPKEWFHIDTDLSSVRTSTFGYQSDWLSRRDSVLNVHDFGRKLLGELQTSSFLRRSRDTPIVLIGHSMGGLVIKKAYLLAIHEAPELANRIKSIVFLATPHRGSDSADLLHSILDVAGQDKRYVNDLMRTSPSLQLINDEFRHVADNVRLWSFFEERKMRMGFKPEFVVGRDSATLGYKGERIFSLDANHREICKFESPEDENYAILRNTLVTIVDELVGYGSEGTQDKKIEQMQAIGTLLNVSEAPKSDLDAQEALRAISSCEWIERKDDFLHWLHDYGDDVSPPARRLSRNSRPSPAARKVKSNCHVYWLSAKPGAGKSVCAAHVIVSLQEKGHDCCYFFFQHGVKGQSLLGAMFRSIAFQMAELHPEIRDLLHKMNAQGVTFDKDDGVAVWRQAFANCILRSPLQQPQFWILDALDECLAAEKLFPLLMKLESACPLRIFITSRPRPDFERSFNRLTTVMPVATDSIRYEDTQADMRLYLASDDARLGLDDEKERLALEERLLAKSNGCFLWIKLVRYELEGIYLQESVESILDEIPNEMSALYERSLANLSKNTREKKLTEALLTWGVCCVRPMKLRELEIALKIDANLQVRDLRRSVGGLCGNLLYVDRNDTVQLAHSTVRDFLLNKDLRSGFAVRREIGNERLAKACLKYMEAEMRPPRSRSFGRGLEMTGRERPVFSSYAASSFSEHIAASSSTSDSLLIATSKFLNTSVLAWIEHIASEEPSLYCLTRTAKNFKQYLERRAKHVSPLGAAFKLVQDWATDLIRLVAKFGRNLRDQPSSIFFLIPSISPNESQLYQQSLNSPAWLKVVGSAATAWDDCVSYIEYRETYATALACGQSSFAIGMKNGMVTVYDQSTCQEKISVNHRLQQSPNAKQSNVVRLLAFGSSDSVFASGGLQTICVWSSEGELLNLFEINEPHVTMVFSIRQDEIIGVTRLSRVARFALKEVEEDLLTPPEQHRRRSSAYVNHQALQLPRQASLAAAISPDQTTLALLYRGKPVYLYNLEDDTVLGTCGRDVDSGAPNISVLTALFNPSPEFNLLAIAHQDGDLAIYDPWTQKELVSVYGDAYSLAASPSGQFLGSGNTGGTIRLWEFETLALLYVIRSGLEEVRSLAFTGDGVRVVDRRDTRVKVWEPSALVRRSAAEEDASLSDATTLIAPETGANDETVTTTATCADEHGLFVFAGSSDGSVVAFEARTGSLTSTIQPETGGEFILAMASQHDILAVANSAQCILVWRVVYDQIGLGTGKLLFKVTVAEPVQQLLVGPGGRRLLVSTTSTDILWDLSTMQTVTRMSPGVSEIVSSRRWTSLGANLTALSCGEVMHLHDWSSLHKLQSIQLVKSSVSSRVSGACTVESFTLAGSGSHLVASLIPHSSSRSLTHLISWVNPFRSLEHASVGGSLAPVLDLPPKYVHSIIGIQGDKVIFLDHDLWICSLDLKDVSATGSSDIRKHVFIPPDFIGGPTVAKPIVTSQGHIVFSKEGQLAIIQGALDWTFS